MCSVWKKQGTPELRFKMASHIVEPRPEVQVVIERFSFPGKRGWGVNQPALPNLKSKLSMRSFHFGG